MKKRESIYKPLLLTTTMRNPERLKNFLIALYPFEKQILTNEIIEQVAKILIKSGLYRPMKTSKIIKEKWREEKELSEREIEFVFKNNPQSHKEAGFDKGWASRFDTWYKIAKELGFVWYWIGEEIIFSDSGKMLLDKEKSENELLVFANAFAKYQRDNPFRRVLNKNIPMVLLLQTIKLLNNDKSFNNAGISRQEIPLLLCWKDNDAVKLFKVIKKLRKNYGYSPSNEVILDICYSYLEETKRDDQSILTDYPDDFIRKMRLTGLFSLRGGGRFLDINSKEIDAVNYITNKYSVSSTFSNEKAFFNYMSKIDLVLLKTLSVYKAPAKATISELKKWTNYYKWDEIKTELLNLSLKKTSQDMILRLIEQPLRLEFLTALAISKKNPSVIIKPNFITDDEGLPTSFALGGVPDIECLEENNTVLVEVTLLTGTQQHIRESFSIHRHLEEYLKRGIQSYSVFISPKTFIDTERYFNFIKQDGLEIRTSNIDTFVQKLEEENSLNDATRTT